MPQSSEMQPMVLGKKLPKPTLRHLVIATTLLLILVGAFRYRYLLVPASVNGEPIFIWEYLTKLHQIAGDQVMGQVITERLIFQTARDQGVTVTPADLDTEKQKLEEQFAESGGLEAILNSQGMTRSEFDRQMRLSLLVREILAQSASISADQVNAEYEGNQSQYADLQEDEAKDKIREMLVNRYAQEQVTPWLEDVRTNARIAIYFPQ